MIKYRSPDTMTVMRTLLVESCKAAEPAQASVTLQPSGRDHVWKNWENKDCVDWDELEGKLRSVRQSLNQLLSQLFSQLV